MVDRDSFVREVDEEVRREQMLKIWRRYGTVIVAGLVVLFAGVGGYQWWKSSRIANEERTGAQFEAATELAASGKTDEALKAFESIAKDAPSGYQTLARLRLAGEHVKAGRTAEALTLYEAIAKADGVEELLRDFAAVQAAMLRLDQADWTEMQNRLTPLVADSRPFHSSAREVLGLAAYKAGKLDEATKLFEQILGDKVTTNGQSRRAQDMLAILTDAAAAKAAIEKPAKADREAAKGDAGTKK